MTADPITRFTDRVRLERPVDVPDALGGASRSFMLAAEAWAQVAPISAAAAPQEDGVVATARVRVTLRAPSPAKPGWRVVTKGRALRVAAREIEGVLVRLLCEEDLT